MQQLLADAGAKRLTPEVPVWHLSAPWWPFSRRARTFVELRIEILAGAIALPGPTHLVMDESPQEYDV